MYFFVQFCHSRNNLKLENIITCSDFVNGILLFLFLWRSRSQRGLKKILQYGVIIAVEIASVLFFFNIAENNVTKNIYGWTHTGRKQYTTTPIEGTERNKRGKKNNSAGRRKNPLQQSMYQNTCYQRNRHTKPMLHICKLNKNIHTTKGVNIILMITFNQCGYKLDVVSVGLTQSICS